MAPNSSNFAHLLHDVSVYHEERLPIELAEACIDWLSDDLEALYTCARVCRAWLPRSYSRRFCVLQYGDVTGSPGFLPPSATNIVRLLDYLGENDRVCTFVRELRLRTRRDRLQLSMLRRLLSHLPHLLICELDGPTLNSFVSGFTYPMRPYTPKALRTLVVRAPRAARNHAELNEVLELFSDVDDLQLSLLDPHPNQADVGRRGSIRRNPGLRVSKLTLDSRFPLTAAQSLRELRFVLDKTTLSSLSCPAFGIQAIDSNALDLFLQEHGSSLSTLNITDVAREVDHSLHLLNICPSIASLRLTVPLPVGSTWHSPNFNGGWNALCSVLWNAPPSLRELYVVLDPISDDKTSPLGVHAREVLVALHTLDWSAVDRHLRRQGKACGHRLYLRIMDKQFEGVQTLLLVAEQLVEAKLTGRVRRYVDYGLISPLALQSVV
ncbi:uncharacterized protein PHACADRAFT_187419 [Phanerochaete carnosa HHB-10118-sp]|uniref:Uncharacterized protein n=1 Tax=Phanerochaete carnosa (strain HHB-10118-sp) TaxID=650164 RepID=K5WP14_PHACS|nr:uncharacterized protein PHACADRAFT_187419 [Phanerochaete carnosa HHB-10118-sp]EKM52067.1 hypothetical protein PHACADRAFT_187419 [Phanerochaete carnosa HHB-10118-sp]